MPFGDYTEENNFGELAGCESNTDGPKSQGRPMEFCDAVTCQSTLEVVPPEVTIGGKTFVPTVATILVVVGYDSEGARILEEREWTLLVAPP